tara:strand:+ start:42 stop:1871 length:1830 start_codon:yes stop_codon:yes gene_type:complete
MEPSASESFPTKARRFASGAPPLRIGGVPEHFNHPWMVANFAAHGVKVEWVMQSCGTGAMIAELEAGNLDIIIALTEGLVSTIVKGSEIRLLGTYVASPLCWAVSAGAESPINSVADLRGKTFGISRFTSGSHMMAYLLAAERGWDPQSEIDFAVKGDFASLRAGVNDGTTDAFMWETFTTKPFHDTGEVKRIGEITTPWPCFMAAARSSVVTQRLEDIQNALAAVHQAALEFHRDVETMPATIAANYSIGLADATEWYSGVRIVAERFVSESAIERAVDALRDVGVLTREQADAFSPENAIDPRVAEMRRDIRSMKLYETATPTLVRWVQGELGAKGLTGGGGSGGSSPSGTTGVDFRALQAVDSKFHYGGVAAVDAAAEGLALGVIPNARVIQLGGGVGGPSRHLAGTYGCQVLAIEKQDALHRVASELTDRSKASMGEGVVTHMAGDFLAVGQHLQLASYDAMCSWLTVLHIPRRGELFALSYKLLRPGARMFIADFYAKAPLTASERKQLHDDVHCPYCPDRETYAEELTGAGFAIASFRDVTAEWTKHTAERAAAFEANRAAHVERHGEELTASLAAFYNTVAALFAGGNLGGCEINCRRPSGW